MTRAAWESPPDSAFSGPALGEEREGAKAGTQSICYHVVMLAAYIVPVVYLAERLAHPVDFVTETLHALAASAVS